MTVMILAENGAFYQLIAKSGFIKGQSRILDTSGKNALKFALRIFRTQFSCRMNGDTATVISRIEKRPLLRIANATCAPFPSLFGREDAPLRLVSTRRSGHGGDEHTRVGALAHQPRERHALPRRGGDGDQGYGRR